MLRLTNTNLPFASGDIDFTLRTNDAATTVTIALDYRLKYWLLGRLLDYLIIQPRYEAGAEALLRGLQRHVERHTAHRRPQSAAG